MWKCLSYQRVLMYTPEISGKIVNACAIIHNMRIHYSLQIQHIEDGYIEPVQMDVNIERNDEIVDRIGPRVCAMVG